MIKVCNKCRLEKPLEMFFKDKDSQDGRYSLCKKCKKKSVYKWREDNRDIYNKKAREWGQNNKEARYKHEIKRRYGCTLEQYNQMLVNQEGKCPICGKLHNPAQKRGRLYVDHNHNTGEIRQLICSSCNSALGYFKDDTRVMAEAIAYIVRHRGSNDQTII